VPRAFERWRVEGKPIAIFSSGSVLAQQLLFRYTDHGDLTRYIDRYFDTTTGAKKDRRSYEAIADGLSFDPNEVMFVSDIVEELDASREAGMETVLAVRTGNAAIESAGVHNVATTFDSL
jgi:enolase-phosphatase E1